MLKQIFICIYFLVFISGCNERSEIIIQIQEKEESEMINFIPPVLDKTSFPKNE